MKLFRLGFAASTTLLFLMVLSASQTVSAQIIISEFRVRGPNGANDEFIELYNNFRRRPHSRRWWYRVRCSCLKWSSPLRRSQWDCHSRIAGITSA